MTVAEVQVAALAPHEVQVVEAALRLTPKYPAKQAEP